MARHPMSAFSVAIRMHSGHLGDTAKSTRMTLSGPCHVEDTQHASHSALMLANLITLAHFSVSCVMSLPKSLGDPESTAPPRSTIRALTLASAVTSLIALLSRSIISVDVPF